MNTEKEKTSSEEQKKAEKVLKTKYPYSKPELTAKPPKKKCAMQ